MSPWVRPPCRQGQHHLVDPGQAPLPLPDQLRLKAAVAVAGHLDLHRADLGQHRLGPGAVAGVPTPVSGRIVLLVAEVAGDLAFQSGLQHPLRELLQQPALPSQLQTAGLGPVDQLTDQLVVQQVRRQLDRPTRFNRLDRDDHVTHQVFP